jgi:hypothetical protein
MVYIPTKPLEHIARDSHEMMTKVAKHFAAKHKDAEARIMDWPYALAAIRAAELAVLLTEVDGDKQQKVADTINTFLGFTPARFRLTPLA